LRNEIYTGRVVWRRHVNAKDPSSGTTVRRASRPEALVTAEVPNLRIIDEALWQRVQDRLKAETALMKDGPAGTVAVFWDQRRPRHLLSGKVIWGACGRVFVQTGQDYLGCVAAVHGSCRNRRTIRRGKLQAQVLDMIGNQLMRPALVAQFVAAYNQERLRVADEARATIESRQGERAALDRKINNLVDAISDGRSSPTIMAKLAEFEALRDKLGDPDSPAAMAAPALHPNIAEAYAASVAA
jgi:site-specific DNA recombinase